MNKIIKLKNRWLILLVLLLGNLMIVLDTPAVIMRTAILITQTVSETVKNSLIVEGYYRAMYDNMTSPFDDYLKEIRAAGKLKTAESREPLNKSDLLQWKLLQPNPLRYDPVTDRLAIMQIESQKHMHLGDLEMPIKSDEATIGAYYRADPLPTDEEKELWRKIGKLKSFQDPQIMRDSTPSLPEFMGGVGNTIGGNIKQSIGNMLYPIHIAGEEGKLPGGVEGPIHDLVHMAQNIVEPMEHVTPDYFREKTFLPTDPLAASTLPDFLAKKYQNQATVNTAHSHGHFKDPYWDTLHFKAHILHHLLHISGFKRDVIIAQLPLEELISKYSYFLTPSDVYTLARLETVGHPGIRGKFRKTPEELAKIGIVFEETPEDKKRMDTDIQKAPLTGELGAQSMALASKYGLHYHIYIKNGNIPNSGYIYFALEKRYIDAGKKYQKQ